MEMIVERLYERLVELLNQQYQSSLVQNFLSEIPESAIIEKDGIIHKYHFPRHGFYFDLDSQRDEIQWVLLYFEIAHGWEGFFPDYLPFSGPLPASICFGDRRDEVRSKLDLTPQLSYREQRPVKIPDLPEEEHAKWLKNLDRGPLVTYHDTYYLQPHRLHFTFRIADENLVCMSISKDTDEHSNERLLKALLDQNLS